MPAISKARMARIVERITYAKRHSKVARLSANHGALIATLIREQSEPSYIPGRQEPIALAAPYSFTSRSMVYLLAEFDPDIAAELVRGYELAREKGLLNT